MHQDQKREVFMVTKIKTLLRMLTACALWLLMALLIITDCRFDTPGVMPRFVFWSITILVLGLCFGTAIFFGLSEERGEWLVYMPIPLYAAEGVIFWLLYRYNAAYHRLHRILNVRVA